MELERAIFLTPDNLTGGDSLSCFFHFVQAVDDVRWGDDIIEPVEICHLYISPGHNFFGHHGREPDDYPSLEVGTIECVTGRGIRGDRFFDYKTNYKGQITFFAIEVFEALRLSLDLGDAAPSLVRRNVVTSGVDLNALIGKEFEIEGVHFQGTGKCEPCYWMDRALQPGAEKFLQDRGGLRAQILSDGTLHSRAALSKE